MQKLVIAVLQTNVRAVLLYMPWETNVKIHIKGNVLAGFLLQTVVGFYIADN